MGNLPYYVSAIALMFSVYQFIKQNTKADASQITTVLIKLENIADDIAEIKADLKSVKAEVQDLRERIAKVEASAAQAHKRLDQAIGGRE